MVGYLPNSTQRGSESSRAASVAGSREAGMAVAQVAGVLVLKDVADRKKRLVLLASVEEAKFRKPVLPGDILTIEMTTVKRKASVVKMKGEARVAGVVVAEATVMCKLADRPDPGSSPKPAE
jgi:3-hydroxymyristoyl/3-hydroxydecanoyl-(acyl carrier protein) dehydratase